MNKIGQPQTLTVPPTDQDDFSATKQTHYKHWDIAALPHNLTTKILLCNSFRDICRYRQVSKHWRDTIDGSSLPARAFSDEYANSHPFAHSQQTGKNDYPFIRAKLTSLGEVGKASVRKLDRLLKSEGWFFRQELRYTLSKVLIETKYFGLPQQSHTIQRPDMVGDVCLSPDGCHVASAPHWTFFSDSSLITIDDSIDGQWQQTQIRLDGLVQSFGFSPDGHYFATVSGSHIYSEAHTIHVWESVNNSWQAQLTLDYPKPNYAQGFRFSPCRQYLVLTSRDFQIFAHVDNTWQEQQNISYPAGGECVVFSPDTRHFLAVRRDHFFHLFQHVAVNGRWQETNIVGQCNRNTQPSFSPSGCHFASVNRDYSGVHTWASVDGTWQQQRWISKCQFLGNALVGQISFCPDGNLMVLFKDYTLQVWEPNTLVSTGWRKKTDFEPYGYCDICIRMRINPDKKHFATYHENTVTVWALVGDQFQEQGTIAHSGPVSDINFSADGQYLVTASQDGTTKVCWQVDEKWQEKQNIQHSDGVGTAQLSPKGNYLLTTCPGLCTANLLLPWKPIKTSDEGRVDMETDQK